MPQNTESCTTGCLHCLPAFSSFTHELTNSILCKVVGFFFKGCPDDVLSNVAFSAAAYSARCLVYLLPMSTYQRIVFYISAIKTTESEPSSKVIYTHHYSAAKILHKNKLNLPSYRKHATVNDCFN